MPIPAGSSYMPVIRIPEKRNSDEIEKLLMKKGQRMFAYYSTPMRPWPDPSASIKNFWTSYEMRQKEKSIIRRRALHQLDLRKVKDKPRIPPFKGDFIRRGISKVKLWYDKRAQRQWEDWTRGRGEVPSIFK